MRHLAHEVPVGVKAKAAVVVLRSPVPLRQATVRTADAAAEAHRPLGVDRPAQPHIRDALPVAVGVSVEVVDAHALVRHARAHLAVEVRAVAP